jgi:hypothetical protein
LGIIRSDSFTGEIGEYIASEFFGLELCKRSSRSIDGFDKNGKSYQIKSKVSKNEKDINFSFNIDLSDVDFLVVVYFDNSYSPIRLLKIKTDCIEKSKVNITKKYLQSLENNECMEVVSGVIVINTVDDGKMNEIRKFGEIYKSLIDYKIIRTRRIVGDLGEYYATLYMGLTLNENVNEKGVDAYDERGNKYEIKTRRVYESGRRKSETRRLNNLLNKESDFLVVVVLDHDFRCAGMWCIPMEEVTNKKSATLRIVNTAKGVKNIVPSKITWLKS